MRVVLLGAPRPIGDNRWKDDIAESGESMGWDFVHLEARGSQPDDVVDLCRGADLFIWARTHHHDPFGDGREMMRRIEDLGVPTVGIHMDLYWGIANREPRINATDQPWWSAQHVFTADGGNQERFKERGVNHHWMPPAMGVRFFGRRDPDPKYQKRYYVFVGSNVPTIHGEHRTRLLDSARKRNPQRFRHFGRAVKVYGGELNKVYASARVVLGDSAPADYYWSDRVPNTLGRGGVLAYPRTLGLEEQGFDDSNMILYDRFDFAPMWERIYSMSEQDLREMSDNALQAIRDKHMWTHRLMQIAETVGLA
jgi:hypothetical protein